MLRSVVAVMLAGCACLAFAQNPDEDAVVVTASRFPERRLDAPVGMVVITAADIARDTARTLPELLSRLGGMYSRDNSGSPDLQLDLRGFGITGDQNTVVLLDGVRLNENDLSPTKLSKIPLQSIERIEILRGSGAVLYGGGATGGTINIITKAPQPGRKEASAFLGVGSYNTADARASVNVAGERLGALISGSHFETDNYRVNNAVRQDNLTGDLRYGDAAGDLSLKFGSEAQRLQLPGARDENQLESDPRGTSTPDDWSARGGNFATLHGRYRGADVEFSADLAYHDQDTQANFASFSFFSDTRVHSVSFSPRMRWTANPLGMRTSLVAGVDWSDWDYGQRGAPDQASISSPSNTVRSTQATSAVYAQYNAEVTPAAKLTLGARAQRVENELIQEGFASSDQTQTLNPHAWEIGLQYALSRAWALYGRTGESFRTATVDDNGFTSTGKLLEPQTAREREAGAEYRRNGARVRASYYEMYLENEIYFSPLVSNPFGGQGANTNLSPTRRSGAELFASFRPSEALEISGNAVYQTAKFRYGTYGGVDVSGKDIPLVPRVLANLRAAWQLAQATQLSAEATYTGHQRYDNDQANAFPRLMPSWALVDLKLTHASGPWTFAGSLNNLLDRKYYSYAIVNTGCATPVCAYPQAGRTFFASAEYALR